MAEERNLTRAALRLHVGQPPLTRSVRALEDELGMPFERSRQGMALLPAGRVFLRHARTIIEDCERARRALREMSDVEVPARACVRSSHEQKEKRRHEV